MSSGSPVSFESLVTSPSVWCVISEFPRTLPTAGDEHYRHPSYQVHPTFSVSRLGRLFISGSFDDANIPKSRYLGLITIAHIREDGTCGAQNVLQLMPIQNWADRTILLAFRQIVMGTTLAGVVASTAALS